LTTASSIDEQNGGREAGGKKENVWQPARCGKINDVFAYMTCWDIPHPFNRHSEPSSIAPLVGSSLGSPSQVVFSPSPLLSFHA